MVWKRACSVSYCDEVASLVLSVAVDGCSLWLPTRRIAMAASNAEADVKNCDDCQRRDLQALRTVMIANAKVNVEECDG